MYSKNSVVNTIYDKKNERMFVEFVFSLFAWNCYYYFDTIRFVIVDISGSMSLTEDYNITPQFDPKHEFVEIAYLIIIIDDSKR